MRKIESAATGEPPGFKAPSVCMKPTRPWRAIIIEAPGALPEAISRSKTWVRRFSADLESPISSGREVGNPDRAGGNGSSIESSQEARAGFQQNSRFRKGEARWTQSAGGDRVRA